jgi:hypothetical protein
LVTAESKKVSEPGGSCRETLKNPENQAAIGGRGLAEKHKKIYRKFGAAHGIEALFVSASGFV